MSSTNQTSESPFDLTLEEFQDKTLLESLEKYGVDKSKADIAQRVSDAIYDFLHRIPRFGDDADEEKLILAVVFRMANLCLENYFKRKARKGGEQ